MKIQLERVKYGKEKTPKDKREYVMVGTNGPVGTLKEWEDSGLLVEVVEDKE